MFKEVSLKTLYTDTMVFGHDNLLTLNRIPEWDNSLEKGGINAEYPYNSYPHLLWSDFKSKAFISLKKSLLNDTLVAKFVLRF